MAGWRSAGLIGILAVLALASAVAQPGRVALPLALGALVVLAVARARRPEAKVGVQALEDERILDRIGGELRDGRATLEQAALRVQVEPPMLAAALQRFHGAVPAAALHRRARARSWRRR